jgi:hypothetical protein
MFKLHKNDVMLENSHAQWNQTKTNNHCKYEERKTCCTVPKVVVRPPTLSAQKGTIELSRPSENAIIALEAAVSLGEGGSDR